MPAKYVTKFSLLQKLPISEVKPKKKSTPHFMGVQGMSALVLQTMSISQTPDFQKPDGGIVPRRITQLAK